MSLLEIIEDKPINSHINIWFLQVHQPVLVDLKYEATPMVENKQL